MLVTRAVLTYVGRMVHLEPAFLGELFHGVCTINLSEQEAPSIDNGWQRRTVYVPQREYWYAQHPETGQMLFCTHSGFGPRIAQTLKDRGVDLHEQDFMPSGLEAPQLQRIAGTTWRGTQPEVMGAMMAKRCGHVKCPTGWGKTFVLRKLTSCYPNSDIVITVPSVDVAKDIHRDLLEFDSTVGFCGDGKHNSQRVTVAVSHSLKHCNPKANLLIGDECHSLVSPMFRRELLRFTRAKFLGLTATPEGRSDNGDMYIEALFGPKIADVPYQEAVDSGNVVPLTVWVFPVRQGPNVSSITRKDLKDKHGIWANDFRNRAIVQSVKYAEDVLQRTEGLAPQDMQLLIMVDKTEHAYRLQQLLPEFTVVTGEVSDDREETLREIGAMTTDQKLCSPKDRAKHKADFASGKLKRVIATFVWSKGVNFLDLDVLVRADGLGSPIQSGQVPGRLSRLGGDGKKGRGILIDFYDQFSSDLKRRSEDRFTSYKQNGWDVQKIT
jgi:superfamily II DNA or RNA helicase